MQVRYRFLDSPLGPLLLAGNARGLVRIGFPRGKGKVIPFPDWQLDDTALGRAADQLDAYFAGRLRQFDLPLALAGTPFQLEVYRALQAIPYGHTASYADIARRIGRPKAFRAVGAANARNPIPIVVPCHRVIGSSGSLTGFGGGLDTKAMLLDLEKGRLHP